MKATQLLALLILTTTLGTAGSSYAGEEKISSKESHQKAYCNDFEMAQDTVDVETIFEDMDASPYASHWLEFWTTPACTAYYNTKSKVPIIFNTATDVVRSEHFPETVREYLLEVKNDKTSWPQIINTKSIDGLTFLDYMHNNNKSGYYNAPALSAASNRIINYLCQHGGVYSKYKDTVKCQ